MDKDHGGSSRLSIPMRQTGGDSSVFMNKSSKKVKVRRLSSLMSTRESLITKDEEEVAEALFALAQTFNKTSELEPVKTTHVEPPNEADVISHGSKSGKRCWVHVYICHFIKADVTSVNVTSNKQAL